MANNSFNALIADVNEKITQMNTVIGETNGAIAAARTASEAAALETEKTVQAAGAASAAAQAANAEANAWDNAVIQTQTLAAGSDADVSVTEAEGKKNMTFKIPRGKDGAAGPKGDTGRSGVIFQLDGTKLYITTG